MEKWNLVATGTSNWLVHGVCSENAAARQSGLVGNDEDRFAGSAEVV